MMAGRDRDQRWREHDFYEILGVGRDATASDIKKGFKRIALSCHPDKVPEAERAAATKRFQLIAEGYEVLSQESSRNTYNSVNPLAGRSKPQPRSGTANRGTAFPSASPPRQAGPSAACFHSSGVGAARAQRRPSKPTVQKTYSGNAMNSDRRPSSGAAGPRCEGCDEACRVVDLRKCPQCPNLICPTCKLCAACIPPDQSDSDDSGPRAPKPNAWRAQREATRPTVWRKPTNPMPTPEAPPAPPPAPAPAPVSAPVREPQPYARQGSRVSATPQPASQQPSPREMPTAREPPAQAPPKPAERPPRPTPRPETKPEPEPAARPAAKKPEETEKRTPTKKEQATPRPTSQPSTARRRSSGLQGWNAEELNGGEVWRRSSGGGFSDNPVFESEGSDEEGEAEKPLDTAAILLTMGFREEDVKAVMGRMSTVESAVDALMARAGHHRPQDDFATTMADAAAGVAGAASKLTSRLSGFLSWGGTGSPLPSLEPTLPSKQEAIASQLEDLGFTRGQAREAAKRCSSVEAAVEWIARHPEA